MEKQEIYKKAKLNNKLGFGKKPAIIVIDLVNGFTDPSLPLGSDLTDVIENTNKLIRIARPKEVPIIFATIAYNENLADGGLWVKKAPAQGKFAFGSSLIKVDERLDYNKKEDTLLVKKYASCFFGTDFASLLSSLRVDTLIITGATTSGCVRATAVDSISSGFIPIIPQEAVGDRAEEPHHASLFDINSKYGDVLEIDEVILYLENL